MSRSVSRGPDQWGGGGTAEEGGCTTQLTYAPVCVCVGGCKCVGAREGESRTGTKRNMRRCGGTAQEARRGGCISHACRRCTWRHPQADTHTHAPAASSLQRKTKAVAQMASRIRGKSEVSKRSKRRCVRVRVSVRNGGDRRRVETQ